MNKQLSLEALYIFVFFLIFIEKNLIFSPPLFFFYSSPFHIESTKHHHQQNTIIPTKHHHTNKTTDSKNKEVTDSRLEGNLEELQQRLQTAGEAKAAVENPHIQNAKVYMPEWNSNAKDAKDVFKVGINKVQFSFSIFE